MMRDYALIACPICEWKTYVLAPTIIDENTLAHLFGVGVLAEIAQSNFNSVVEETFKEHFQTHTMVDLVRALRARDDRIKQLDDQIKELLG